jgi:4-hydroxy-3-methylbut-2-en-1-yl diphosphate reductase
MQIFLARTQGFCAGVARAINIVDKALEKYGTPLYVFHEIVHNTAVVDAFRKRGVVFVDDINDVPDGARVIFSAHGVAPQVIEKAKQKALKAIDATCPLVSKVHQEAVRLSKAGSEVVLIGHKGHEEVVGTAGYVKPALLHIVQTAQDIGKLEIPVNKHVGFITQTTLSVDETREIILKLRAQYPHLTGPSEDDICYATQNRQDAIKELVGLCDIILICGSRNSSNSNRLREKAEQLGRTSYIIDNASELDVGWLKDKDGVGISSGASVPREIVEEVIQKISDHFSPVKIHRFDNPEKEIVFPMPKL